MVPEHGITFSRLDASNLAQAKAANYCGQLIVTRALGVAPHEVDRLYLAGGFANYVDARSAIDIGFLAPVAEERIVKLGNAALRGTREVLLSVRKRRALEAMVAEIEHVELETAPDFFEVFVDGCRLEPMGAAPGLSRSHSAVRARPRIGRQRPNQPPHTSAMALATPFPRRAAARGLAGSLLDLPVPRIVSPGRLVPCGGGFCGAVALPVLVGSGAAAQTLTAVSFGGAYSAQKKHMIDPYVEATGVDVRFEDYSGGIGELKAQVESDAVIGRGGRRSDRPGARLLRGSASDPP